MFDLVEKHGKVLEPLLRRDDRQLHFIYGATKGEERERIRHMIGNNKIWIGTNKGLFVYNEDKVSFSILKDFNELNVSTILEMDKSNCPEYLRVS